jgi:hypothetical protein
VVHLNHEYKIQRKTIYRQGSVLVTIVIGFYQYLKLIRKSTFTLPSLKIDTMYKNTSITKKCKSRYMYIKIYQSQFLLNIKIH